MGRRLPETLSLGVLVAVAILASSSAAAKPGARAVETGSTLATVAGRATIVTSFESSLRGSFTIRGAISDRGSVQARRAVAANRVRLTETLKGKMGTIRVLATQVCGSASSTWRVLSGSGEYRARAHRPRSWHGPDRVRRQAAARPSRTGRYPVAQDGSFAIAESDYAVTGKFTGAAVGGTLSYESSRTDAFGTLRTCRSGTLTWQATSPPPPPPSVTPGRYCGVTAQTRICFDVTPELRVARFEMEVTLVCNVQTSLVYKCVYPGTIAIRSNGSFSAGISSAFPLEGGGLAASFSITGTFQAGVASGSLLLLKPQVRYEGTWYRCRLGRISWSASRVG